MIDVKHCYNFPKETRRKFYQKNIQDRLILIVVITLKCSKFKGENWALNV
jgi:hypothetical protein